MGRKNPCGALSVLINFLLLASLQFINAKTLGVSSVTNLSTSWDDIPTLYTNTSTGTFIIKPILAKTNSDVGFVSGFWCNASLRNCLFSVLIFPSFQIQDPYKSPPPNWIRYPHLVWSANRRKPVRYNATLRFMENGNLVLKEEDGSLVWSSDTGGMSVSGLNLTEEGNLVLFDRNNTTVWQSFDHPSEQNEKNIHQIVYKEKELEDCKKACLNNCSCKAVLFQNVRDSQRGCLFLSEVLTLVNQEDGVFYNSSAFLKVQSYPTVVVPSSKKSRQVTAILIKSGVGAFFGVVAMVVAFLIFLYGKGKESKELEEIHLNLVPGMLSRFSYEDLKAATNDFTIKLGQGGFGSVFEGTLSNGTKVAVKRLDGLARVMKSFLAEVETIGSIHHVNLVRLIGYCAEKTFGLLVYEYMPNGSLDKWIFRKHLTLGWQSRRKIILHTAKGLAYLHEDCRQKIIHLDIKPQNILLDENFNAKVSDFGLSKLIDRDQSQVVTTMRGTPGYLAPEWLSSSITEKVDVYSFGIMVLEILCGRKNLDRSQPEEDMHLLALFKRKAEEGRLPDIIDKHHDEMQQHEAEVVEMMRIVVWCLQSDYVRRPPMSVVVKVLEGLVDVETNLDYSFTNLAIPRKVGAAGLNEDVICPATTLLPSTLSGPR